MKPLFDFCTWLLEKDLRAKNAMSFLVALLAVVLLHFSSKDTPWVVDLDQRSKFAYPIALLVGFLIVFLLVWSIYGVTAWFRQQLIAKSRILQREEKQLMHVSETLENLSEWQERFLVRFINESKRQIQEHEIGGFKAVWGDEIEVLIAKGVIRRFRGTGVYEIESIYHDCLQEVLTMEPDTSN